MRVVERKRVELSHSWPDPQLSTDQSVTRSSRGSKHKQGRQEGGGLCFGSICLAQEHKEPWARTTDLEGPQGRSCQARQYEKIKADCPLALWKGSWQGGFRLGCMVRGTVVMAASWAVHFCFYTWTRGQDAVAQIKLLHRNGEMKPTNLKRELLKVSVSGSHAWGTNFSAKCLLLKPLAVGREDRQTDRQPAHQTEWSHTWGTNLSLKSLPLRSVSAWRKDKYTDRQTDTCSPDRVEGLTLFGTVWC